MLRKALQIHPDDVVGVAVVDLPEGEVLHVSSVVVTLQEPIAKGHKFALRPISKNSPVIKYGSPIGYAKEDIPAGAWVHVHNVRTALENTGTYTYTPVEIARPPLSSVPTFRGYKRATGRIGTRNEIWILPTVGCVNKTAERIAALANQELRRDNFDGAYAFSHPFGCSQLGDDLENTKKIIAALAQHPNAGGVLLVGLGCENNRLDALLESIPQMQNLRLRSFCTQDVRDEIETGLAAVRELFAEMEEDRRDEVPLTELVLGMKCGGSDGFSGITGNALVGRIADLHTAAGGTTLLTEVPEMFGAEHELMNRAVSQEVFNAIVNLINSFKQYYLDHNQPVYENPSPGNKAGGITTLEEKSLGAIQKGGKAPVVGVLQYGEVLTMLSEGGIVLLNAPGNDGVSTTALTASGATMILFTTGRGTPLGAPVPTVKISTNTSLYQNKPQWIDFDAGQLVSTDRSADEITKELLSYIVAVASGIQKTKNELSWYKEIALWKKGVTL